MEQLARTILFLEMLFVNLITSHYCMKTKNSLVKIMTEFALFTVLVLFAAIIIRIKLNLIYLNISMIILIGFTYFFPLKHLYDESSIKILNIMFFSWIHTITVTYFSLQLSEAFAYEKHFQIALTIQTVIYLFTTPVIVRYIKNKFLYILRNIPREMNKYLITLSMAEFSILSLIYVFFAKDSGLFWKEIAVVLAALTAAVSYRLIYVIVKSCKNINILNQLAYTDYLTEIKNRLALFKDCEELISQNRPFTIVYMDLDSFKKVNDTYGHSVGDDYLKKFTEATKKIVGSRGDIYRMSGDEFVYMCMDDNIDSLLATFNKKITNLLEMDIPFMGVSIGSARFPQDSDSIDELIKKADRLMYKVKRNTKNETKPLK